MLVAENIIKRHGELTILKSVSLTIKEGETTALLGVSGAGKTTLLQILGTLDLPDSGALVFDGRSLLTLKPNELSRFRNEKLGFIFQFHHLLAEFNAVENVSMPAWLAGVGKKNAETRAVELLNRLHLGERLRHLPSQLSGGEMQRVAVARALMNRPKLILADEPTGNLDAVNGRALFDYFIELAAETGVSFLIATHNEELAALTDKRLRIVDGSLQN